MADNMDVDVLEIDVDPGEMVSFSSEPGSLPADSENFWSSTPLSLSPISTASLANPVGPVRTPNQRSRLAREAFQNSLATIDEEVELPLIDLRHRLRNREEQRVEPLGPLPTDLDQDVFMGLRSMPRIKNPWKPRLRHIVPPTLPPRATNVRDRLGPGPEIFPQNREVFETVTRDPTETREVVLEERNLSQVQASKRDREEQKGSTDERMPPPKNKKMEVVKKVRGELVLSNYQKKKLQNKKVAALANRPQSFTIPRAPPRDTDVSIVRVEAGYSVESSDYIVHQESDPLPVVIHPTPANVLQDDEEEEDWDKVEDLSTLKKYQVSASYDFDDTNDEATGPVRWCNGWKQNVIRPGGKKNRLFVDIPEVGSDQLPQVFRAVDWHFTAKPHQLQWFSLTDQWLLLDRRLDLARMEKTIPLQKMPTNSVQEMVDLVRESRRMHGTDETNFQEIHGKPNLRLPQTVENFIQKIRDTRVLCVNTEGKDYRKENGDPRVVVVLGAWDGSVLLFGDYQFMPRELQEMLEDPTYTKIGSGLSTEHTQFARIEKRIRNWCEIGCARVALYPPAWTLHEERVEERKRTNKHDENNPLPITHGIDWMVLDLVKSDFFPATYRRSKFCAYWEYSIPETKEGPTDLVKRGRPPTRMHKHLLENVRIPFCELILIVAHFAEARGYNLEKEPYWPIAWEVLDLCRLKSPEVFQANFTEDPHFDQWISRITTGHRVDHLSLPAGSIEMAEFFYTRADFLEPYFEFDLEKTAERVYQRFHGPGAIEFPSYRLVARLVTKGWFENRCLSCGSTSHILAGCPVDKNPTCEYEHDGEKSGPHSLLCCPNLHRHCKICAQAGHHWRVHTHEDFRKTARELRKRFWRYMPEGLFTSLPLLACHVEGRKMISGQHWKASFESSRYQNSVATRFYLGITKYVPLSPLGEYVRQNDEVLFARADAEIKKLVLANAHTTDRKFTPVPKKTREDLIHGYRKEIQEERKRELTEPQTPKNLSRNAYRRWRRRHEKPVENKKP